MLSFIVSCEASQIMHNRYVVNNPLTDEHENLIVGCSKTFQHHIYSKLFQNKLRATPIDLHSSNHFYTVDAILSGADLVGNIFNEAVLTYLKKNKFKLICFEATPQLFSPNGILKMDGIINESFNMLHENGIFMILASGNFFLNEPIFNLVFNHVESFQLYSQKDSPYPTCSIVTSKNGLTGNEIENIYVESALRSKYGEAIDANKNVFYKSKMDELKQAIASIKEKIKHHQAAKSNPLKKSDDFSPDNKRRKI